VHFERDVILVQTPEGLQALTARCPHLGCRINRIDQDALVCPCHGSRFDLQGQRLAGPAQDHLRALSIVPTDEEEMVEIDLSV